LTCPRLIDARFRNRTHQHQLQESDKTYSESIIQSFEHKGLTAEYHEAGYEMERDTDVGCLRPMINRSFSSGMIASEEQGKEYEQRSAMCIADGLGDEGRNITPTWGSPRAEGRVGGARDGGGRSNDVSSLQIREGEGRGGAWRGEGDQDTGSKGKGISRELINETHGARFTPQIDTLSSLPDEIILSILTYLDISDLFSLTKVSPHPVTTDPNPTDLAYRPPTASATCPSTPSCTTSACSGSKPSSRMPCLNAPLLKLSVPQDEYGYLEEILRVES